jgi:hypothetical protein
VRAHNLPTFAQTVPNDHIYGTTLKGPKNITVPPAGGASKPVTIPAATPATGMQKKRPHHL